MVYMVVDLHQVIIANLSDRGVQYASSAYIARLEQAGIQISMSARGNPYDNAKAGSFFKTLKHEEVYLTEYQTFADAQAHLSHFIDAVYNSKRLHSSLGYRPPAEFEAAYYTSFTGCGDLPSGSVNGVQSTRFGWHMGG
jgi:transposase InsO family protein